MFSTGGKLLVLRFTFNSSFYMQVSVSIDMIEDERTQGMRTEKIWLKFYCEKIILCGKKPPPILHKKRENKRYIFF